MMKRAFPSNSAGLPRPHIFAVSGGHVGVGVTTIGLNLAIALVQQGQRTVIVDADMACADVARLCGITPTANIAEVLAGKRSIHEVLERGPGGIQLAAGCDSPHCRSLCTTRSIGRLLAQVAALGRHAEAVVIDAGNTPTDLTSRIWQVADQVLVVTTLDPVAVMDAYSLIKSLSAEKDELGPLSLLVNQVGSETVASDVHRRMQRSCQRFLGVDIKHGGWFPPVDRNQSAAMAPVAWMLEEPAPDTAQKMEQFAGRLLAGGENTGLDAA